MTDRKLEKTFSNYRIWIDYVFNQKNVLKIERNGIYRENRRQN